MDYIHIGSSPVEEDCAQVGSPDYATRARAECKRFAAQIMRHYPEPENGYLKIKSNPHDFGTYYEVVAVFDENDEEATKWAFAVESDEKDVLRVWDDHHIA
jgi:hypothetical protein